MIRSLRWPMPCALFIACAAGCAAPTTAGTPSSASPASATASAPTSAPSPSAPSSAPAATFPAATASPRPPPPPGPDGRVVEGTVGYRERIALPPTATIRLQLVDVSRADAPAIVLGEQRIEAGGRQPPFAFSIPYDPARIAPGHEYAVQARIEDDGRLLFINDVRYRVLSRGAPQRVDMVLRAVGGPGRP